MRTIVGICKVLLIITLVIVVHEFGHFLAARAYGIPVKQFAIGFGPTLASTVIGGTEFSLKPILLGGFNELDAEAVENAPTAAQLTVIGAGSAFGMLMTLLLSVVTRGSKGIGRVIALFVMNMAWIAITLLGPLLSGRRPDSDGPPQKSRGMSGPFSIIKGLSQAGWQECLEFSGMINGMNLSVIPIVDGGRFAIVALAALGFPPVAVMWALAALTLAALFLPSSPRSSRP